MMNMDEDTVKTTTAQLTASNVEIVRQQRFEVGPRYTDLKFIGEGAYGMSWSTAKLCPCIARIARGEEM